MTLSNCGAREDSWESLDCREIKPVNPKGNQPWIFTGRTDSEAEAPILWPPDAKSQFTGKDPDSRKDWGQQEKGATEMRWLDDITNSMNMSSRNSGRQWRTGKPDVSMGLQRVRHDLLTEQQQEGYSTDIQI